MCLEMVVQSRSIIGLLFAYHVLIDFETVSDYVCHRYYIMLNLQKVNKRVS